MQKLLFPLALIICIFACCCPSCATRPSIPVAAPSPLRPTMIVVSGQARIRSDGGHILVVEGQEAVITAGDQITAGEDGLKLLLANGSLLYLNPGTELQVVTFSAEGTVKLRQLKGRLEVEAISPLLTVEISTSFTDAFTLKTMQFTATPTVRDTTFQLWLDGVDAHLTVESGEVQVTSDDRTETIRAGSEVTASPGRELVVSQGEPPVEPTVTAVVLTMTPGLTRLSPTATAAAIVAPKYPAPGLAGPADGSEFKDDETVLLLWDTPTLLAEDEWYEVQLWREGDVPYTVVQRTREGTWKVEPKYYPGRYQWCILIVRSQEGQKEVLSPPSDTRRFSWLPVVQTPTATTSPSLSGASVDLTVYLRGTNNAPGFAVFSGEKVNAGTIYNEGGTVYGDVAVQIGNTKYHFDPNPEPGEPEQLPHPYRMEFKFSDSLLAATEGFKPGFNPEKAQFWVGTLNCNSATPPDKPYKIEMALYAGGEARKHTEISFLVADDPLCGDGCEEPDPCPRCP
jgi:mannose-6-phosphate isomerase-like protein (cupin superfamily)